TGGVVVTDGAQRARQFGIERGISEQDLILVQTPDQLREINVENQVNAGKVVILDVVLLRAAGLFQPDSIHALETPVTTERQMPLSVIERYAQNVIRTGTPSFVVLPLTSSLPSLPSNAVDLRSASADEVITVAANKSAGKLFLISQEQLGQIHQTFAPIRDGGVLQQLPVVARQGRVIDSITSSTQQGPSLSAVPTLDVDLDSQLLSQSELLGEAAEAFGVELPENLNINQVRTRSVVDLINDLFHRQNKAKTFSPEEQGIFTYRKTLLEQIIQSFNGPQRIGVIIELARRASIDPGLALRLMDDSLDSNQANAIIEKYDTAAQAEQLKSIFGEEAERLSLSRSGRQLNASKLNIGTFKLGLSEVEETGVVTEMMQQWLRFIDWRLSAEEASQVYHAYEILAQQGASSQIPIEAVIHILSVLSQYRQMSQEEKEASTQWKPQRFLIRELVAQWSGFGVNRGMIRTLANQLGQGDFVGRWEAKNESESLPVLRKPHVVHFFNLRNDILNRNNISAEELAGRLTKAYELVQTGRIRQVTHGILNPYHVQFEAVDPAEEETARILNEFVDAANFALSESDSNIRRFYAYQVQYFLELLSNTPGQGRVARQIGMGKGKSTTVIILQMMAGLIRGHQRVLISLTDETKVNEFYSEKIQKTMDRLGWIHARITEKDRRFLHGRSASQEAGRLSEWAEKDILIADAPTLGFSGDATRRPKGRAGQTAESALYQIFIGSQGYSVYLIDDEFHTKINGAYIEPWNEKNETRPDKEFIDAGLFLKDFYYENLDRLTALAYLRSEIKKLKKAGRDDISEQDIERVAVIEEITELYQEMADVLGRKNDESFLDAVRQYGEEQREYFRDPGEKIGFVRLNDLVIKENEKGNPIAPVFHKAFFIILASYMNRHGYKNVTAEELIKRQSGRSELIYIRAAAKQLAVFQGKQIGDDYSISIDANAQQKEGGTAYIVVPHEFGIQTDRRFSNSMEAVIMHIFGMLSYHGKIGINGEEMKVNPTRDKDNLFSVGNIRVNPLSTRFDYLELLADIFANGGEGIVMTGTLPVGAAKLLGMQVDVGELLELMAKYFGYVPMEFAEAIADFLWKTYRVRNENGGQVTAEDYYKKVDLDPSAEEAVLEDNDIHAIRGLDGMLEEIKADGRSRFILPSARAVNKQKLIQQTRDYLRQTNSQAETDKALDFIYLSDDGIWRFERWNDQTQSFEAAVEMQTDSTKDEDGQFKVVGIKDFFALRGEAAILKQGEAPVTIRGAVAIGNAGTTFGFDSKLNEATYNGKRRQDLLEEYDKTVRQVLQSGLIAYHLADEQTLLSEILQNLARRREVILDKDTGVGTYNEGLLFIITAEKSITLRQAFYRFSGNQYRHERSANLQLAEMTIRLFPVRLMQKIAEQIDSLELTPEQAEELYSSMMEMLVQYTEVTGIDDDNSGETGEFTENYLLKRARDIQKFLRALISPRGSVEYQEVIDENPGLKKIINRFQDKALAPYGERTIDGRTFRSLFEEPIEAGNRLLEPSYQLPQWQEEKEGLSFEETSPLNASDMADVMDRIPRTFRRDELPARAETGASTFANFQQSVNNFEAAADAVELDAADEATRDDFRNWMMEQQFMSRDGEEVYLPGRAVIDFLKRLVNADTETQRKLSRRYGGVIVIPIGGDKKERLIAAIEILKQLVAEGKINLLTYPEINVAADAGRAYTAQLEDETLQISDTEMREIQKQARKTVYRRWQFKVRGEMTPDQRTQYAREIELEEQHLIRQAVMQKMGYRPFSPMDHLGRAAGGANDVVSVAVRGTGRLFTLPFAWRQHNRNQSQTLAPDRLALAQTIRAFDRRAKRGEKITLGEVERLISDELFADNRDSIILFILGHLIPEGVTQVELQKMRQAQTELPIDYSVGGLYGWVTQPYARASAAKQEAEWPKNRAVSGKVLNAAIDIGGSIGIGLGGVVLLGALGMSGTWIIPAVLLGVNIGAPLLRKVTGLEKGNIKDPKQFLNSAKPFLYTIPAQLLLSLAGIPLPVTETGWRLFFYLSQMIGLGKTVTDTAVAGTRKLANRTTHSDSIEGKWIAAAGALQEIRKEKKRSPNLNEIVDLVHRHGVTARQIVALLGADPADAIEEDTELKAYSLGEPLQETTKSLLNLPDSQSIDMTQFGIAELNAMTEAIAWIEEQKEQGKTLTPALIYEAMSRFRAPMVVFNLFGIEEGGRLVNRRTGELITDPEAKTNDEITTELNLAMERLRLLEETVPELYRELYYQTSVDDLIRYFGSGGAEEFIRNIARLTTEEFLAEELKQFADYLGANSALAETERRPLSYDFFFDFLTGGRDTGAQDRLALLDAEAASHYESLLKLGARLATLSGVAGDQIESLFNARMAAIYHAQRLVEAGKGKEAAGIYKTLYGQNHYDGYALNAWADLLMTQGEFAEAARRYGEAASAEERNLSQANAADTRQELTKLYQNLNSAASEEERSKVQEQIKARQGALQQMEYRRRIQGRYFVQQAVALTSAGDFTSAMLVLD
ncbi:MAG: hypothetical protein HYS56_01810, partial [Candidatus Omnitrophica bacterium]|nr:hypothetical protein [Candidatus Omnitrophota bacterium]